MLDLHVPTILFELLNFVVLSLLLYAFLFRPVMERVKERAAEKERLEQEIARERAEAVRLRQEWEARLAVADQEADEILAAAREKAEEERVELLQAARAEVERILVEAQADAYRLRQQVMDEAYQEIENAVLDVSGHLLRRVTPPALHDLLTEQLNESVWELGRKEIRRVEAFRRSLEERTPVAEVTAAQPLSPEQQGKLARTLTALADHHVNLELKIDPSLVAGVRVRLGDMVIDNSIGGRMDEMREHVSKAIREHVLHG